MRPFSRPMRVKNTSSLREIFQHYSLVRSLSTNARQQHIEELSNSKTRVNQTMPTDLLPLTIAVRMGRTPQTVTTNRAPAKNKKTKTDWIASMNQTEFTKKSCDIETVFKSGKTFSISLRKLEEKIKYILEINIIHAPRYCSKFCISKAK